MINYLKSRNIFGNDVILVPYKREHVAKYHGWMLNPTIRHLTGSEPLSLEEEYCMQQKWIHDNDKITFIVLDSKIYSQTNCEVASMIGDVNIFLNDPNDLSVGEIEIMIAEEDHRGKGKGKEALLLMLRFAIELIKIEKMVAKIKMDNKTSIKLFERLGFVKESQSDYFREFTYSWIKKDNSLGLINILQNTNHIQYELL
jgi:N-acetyltransferase 9-like protein